MSYTHQRLAIKVAPQLNIQSSQQIFIDEHKHTITALNNSLDRNDSSNPTISHQDFCLTNKATFSPIIDFLSIQLNKNIDTVYIFNDQSYCIQKILNYLKINLKMRVAIIEEGGAAYVKTNFFSLDKLWCKAKGFRYSRILKYRNHSTVIGSFTGIDMFICFHRLAFPTAKSTNKKNLNYALNNQPLSTNSENVVFIAQPTVQEGLINEQQYQQTLMQLLAHISPKKPLYIQHPRERLENYSLNLQNFLTNNFQLIRLDISIEEAIETNKIQIKYAVSLSSSSLFYLSEFYGIKCFMLPYHRNYQQSFIKLFLNFLFDINTPNNKIRKYKNFLINHGIQPFEKNINNKKFLLIANNTDITEPPKDINAHQWTIVRFNHARNIDFFASKTDILCLRTNSYWSLHAYKLNSASTLVNAFIGIINVFRRQFLPLILSGLSIGFKLIHDKKMKPYKNTCQFFILADNKLSDNYIKFIQKRASIRIHQSIDWLVEAQKYNFEKKYSLSSGMMMLLWLTEHYPNAEFVLLGFDFYARERQKNPQYSAHHPLDFEQQLLQKLSLKHNIKNL